MSNDTYLINSAEDAKDGPLLQGNEAAVDVQRNITQRAHAVFILVFSFTISILCYLPAMIASIVILLQNSEPKCYYYKFDLHTWVIVYNVADFVQLICDTIIFLNNRTRAVSDYVSDASNIIFSRARSRGIFLRPVHDIVNPSSVRTYNFFTNLIEAFRFAWFIIGWIYYAKAPACSPAVRDLVLGLLIYQILQIFSVCVLMILLSCLLIPLLMCCGNARVLGLLGIVAPNPANQEIIDLLPLVKYTLDLFDDDKDKECSICSQEYQIDEDLRKLPCGTICHYFHKMCLDKWLKISNSCPVCRHVFTRDSLKDSGFNRVEEMI